MNNTRLRLFSTFFAYLLFTSQFSLTLPMKTTPKTKEYELNPEYLGLLYHRASSNALLNGKAKKELVNLPKTEKIIFDQCSKESKNVLQLAKCVAAVLDARDQLKQFEAKPSDPECSPDESDGNWVMSLIRAVYRKWNCGNKDNVKLVEKESKSEVRYAPQKKLDFNRKFDLNSRGRSRLKDPKIRRPLKIEKIRKKRSLRDISPRCLIPENIEKLRSIQSQFTKSNHVLKYIYSTTKSNQKFFEEVDMKVEYRNKYPAKNSPLEQAKQFAEQLESYEDRDIVSILSPKLLNLMPESPSPGSKRFLSPNMLSFQDEGFLPLPRVLQMSTSDHCETLKWLDLLMNMTGATKMFEKVDSMFGKFMKEIEDIMYPRIKEVEVQDKKFDMLRELTSFEQNRQMDEHGYSLMSEDQLKIVYGEDGILPSPNGTEFSHTEDLEQVFENEIRMLSKMTEKEFLDAHKAAHTRTKRQSLLDVLLPMTTQPQVFGIRVLSPFAFVRRIRNANVMGPFIVSPLAFFLQIVSPTVLHIDPLSPRAFVATIFSPVLLTARILAPSAFRLMLFSPLAVVTWILVPEAFLAKIFAPKILDARILSPETLSAIILSPAAGILRVGSPNLLNFLVLSPSFGTYQLYSGNRYVIQILSPGILGVDSNPLVTEPISGSGQIVPGDFPVIRSLIAPYQIRGNAAPTNPIQINPIQINPIPSGANSPPGSGY